ncbi:MAG: hypothetical protein IH865_12250 [Chloroflexi bacterium]|nr:hypothetical protein [Chloroflexota bacterium]
MAKADVEKSLLAKEPWRSPLEELERTLSEVSRAVRGLRDALESGDAGGTAEPPIQAVVVEEAETQAGESDTKEAETQTGESDTTNEVSSVGKPTEGTTVVGRAKSSITSFEHVWERLQREGHADSAGPAETEAETRAAESDTANKAVRSSESTEGATAVGGAKSGIADFEHVWARLQREGDTRSAARAEEAVEVRGLSSLPSQYRITIEDRDGTPVDLLPVQRALRAFASADDVSLLNFANGTAVISLRTTGELDLDKLASAIGMATSRDCEVIPQDQGKLFLRLSLEEGRRNG